MNTTSLLRSPWLHPLNDVQLLNDWAQRIHPLWSLTEIRAEVVEITPETADTASYRLRPNRLWRGHQAGQHVSVQAEINGVRHSRTFTLSSAPEDGDLRLTIKRQPQGVTAALHRQLRTGDVLTLSAPRGHFTLPAVLERPLLMLSAGSGITPMLAMLRSLRARGVQHPVTLVHCCRSEADFIGHAELQTLAAQMPTLRILPHYSARAGRLTMAQLEALVPEAADCDTLLCGPTAFAQTVQAHWAAQGRAERLRSESFGGLAPVRADDGARVQVSCTRSAQDFSAGGHAALLPQAEAAGLQPKSGCRIGICRSCQCRKTAGTVKNLITGQMSGPGEELIQLCISAPQSDLTLDL